MVKPAPVTQESVNDWLRDRLERREKARQPIPRPPITGADIEAVADSRWHDAIETQQRQRESALARDKLIATERARLRLASAQAELRRLEG